MHKGKHRTRPARMDSIFVGVVCGHASEREALVRALGTAESVRALDCGTGVAESVTRVRDLEIGIVLVALELGPAVSFVAALHAVDPKIRCIVLLRSESEAVIARLAAAGAAGFVPPTACLAACMKTIRAVKVGRFDWPPKLASMVRRIKENGGPVAQGRFEPGIAGLHGRRLEVAECIARDLTNKAIGDRLGIAEGTVKNHVHAVLTALSVERRWQVAAALRWFHTAPIELVGRQGPRNKE